MIYRVTTLHAYIGFLERNSAGLIMRTITHGRNSFDAIQQLHACKLKPIKIIFTPRRKAFHGLGPTMQITMGNSTVLMCNQPVGA